MELQEGRKKVAISKLNAVLEENVGLTTLFQLYEAAIEFADEEEERRTKIIEQYKNQLGQVNFPLNQMKIYKQFDNIFATDLAVLKNNNLENKIYELNLIDNSENKYQFEIKKCFYMRYQKQKMNYIFFVQIKI